MTITLDKTKPDKGAKKKRKRIGRGNAAGQGTYSGKGLKGQKARSGVSNLKRLGMKQVLLRTPKKRGFKSHQAKAQVVKMTDINKYFKTGELVSPKTLKSKELIDNTRSKVKILGGVDLSVKELRVKDVLVSASAKEQIDKNKGKILN